MSPKFPQWQAQPSVAGYYWLKRMGCAELTLAYYSGTVYQDGSRNTMPWQLLGSDEFFTSEQLQIVACLPQPEPPVS